ncbi:hypothetical protein PAMA_016921 [Pampus argenteus]
MTTMEWIYGLNCVFSTVASQQAKHISALNATSCNLLALRCNNLSTLCPADTVGGSVAQNPELESSVMAFIREWRELNDSSMEQELSGETSRPLGCGKSSEPGKIWVFWVERTGTLVVTDEFGKGVLQKSAMNNAQTQQLQPPARDNPVLLEYLEKNSSDDLLKAATKAAQSSQKIETFEDTVTQDTCLLEKANESTEKGSKKQG